MNEYNRVLIPGRDLSNCEEGKSSFSGMMSGMQGSTLNLIQGHARADPSVIQYGDQLQSGCICELCGIAGHTAETCPLAEPESRGQPTISQNFDDSFGDRSSSPTTRSRSMSPEEKHSSPAGLSVALDSPVLERETSAESNNDRERSSSPTKRSSKKERSKLPGFSQFWEEEVWEAAYREGLVVRGVKRNIITNPDRAYVTVEGFKQDIMLVDFVSQNRSINGDTVIVKINPKKKWWLRSGKPEKDDDEEEDFGDDDDESNATTRNLIEEAQNLDKDSDYYATGTVVAVANRPDKCYCGFVKCGSSYNRFVPMRKELQNGFVRNDDPALPKRVKGASSPSCLLVTARYSVWPVDKSLPNMIIGEVLGDADDPAVNEQAILREFDITDKDYSEYPLIQEELDKIAETISMKEIQSRVDLREKCIFTIDPITARDLDDALSCRPLPDGTFEVGVHIADVSHYVIPDSELDKEARSRLSSIYLTSRVIPMLPKKLSNNLCSLNPGVDRLAFSVIWKMDRKGCILKQWIGRTVIRSCCKMNYNLAGAIIDGKCRASENGEWDRQFADIAPPEATVCEPHTQSEVIQVVKNLMMLADVLHANRFKEGGINFNKMELSIQLDETRKKPIGVYVDEEVKSHGLVEEMMLLANKCVAAYIAKTFPSVALLRCHPPPKADKAKELLDFCLSSRLGSLDISSSKSLRESLSAIIESSRDRVPFVKDLLSLLLVRCMNRACYFCTGLVDEEAWGHWALGFDRYTHFTSPIRRYPDVIVHRMLQDSLLAEKQALSGQEVTQPSYSQDDISEICKSATQLHINARMCSDLDTVFYICKLLNGQANAVQQGLVYKIREKSFSVYVPQYGIADDIFTNRQTKILHDENTGDPFVQISWGSTDDQSSMVQTIRQFDIIPVAVKVKPNTLPCQPCIVIQHPSTVVDAKPLPRGIAQYDNIE